MESVVRQNLTQQRALNDAVVSIKVPQIATRGAVPGKDISYWQWPLNLRGGIVNVYLHIGDKEGDPRGQRFVCRLEVWNRQIDGGKRWFNHLDLHPCDPADVTATHRFVTAVEGQHTWPDDAIVFSAGCFNLSARIVILGKDDKLKETSIQPKPKRETVNTNKAASKKGQRGSTKQSKLDAVKGPHRAQGSSHTVTGFDRLKELLQE